VLVGLKIIIIIIIIIITIINVFAIRSYVASEELMGSGSVLLRKGEEKKPGEVKCLSPGLKHSNRVTINEFSVVLGVINLQLFFSLPQRFANSVRHSQ